MKSRFNSGHHLALFASLSCGCYCCLSMEYFKLSSIPFSQLFQYANFFKRIFSSVPHCRYLANTWTLVIPLVATSQSPSSSVTLMTLLHTNIPELKLLPSTEKYYSQLPFTWHLACERVHLLHWPNCTSGLKILLTLETESKGSTQFKTCSHMAVSRVLFCSSWWHICPTLSSTVNLRLKF